MKVYMASPVIGDRKLTLVNTLAGRIWCMPDVMSAYRRHSGSWNRTERPGGSACYHYFESYRMEELAYGLYQITIDFSQLRKHAWFGTVAYFIRNPLGKNLRAVFDVFFTGGKYLQKIGVLAAYLLRLPKKLFSKK